MIEPIHRMDDVRVVEANSLRILAKRGICMHSKIAHETRQFRMLRGAMVASILLVGGQLLGCGSSVEAPNGNGTAGEGLPCDVTKVLQDRCWTCHGVTPVAGAPISLASYDDLVSPAKSDASKTAIQLSVERMGLSAAPMPPGGGAIASEIAVLEAWIAAGMPKGDCQNAAPDPFGGGVVCTSGKTWTLGTDVDDPLRPQMNPGMACIKCHSEQIIDKPDIFLAAGTVYPTGHEPDACYGVTDSAATNMIVRLVDSLNNSYDLPVNATGNFMLDPGVNFVPPYSAKVISSNGERAMSAKQTSGDCNACHTEQGGGAGMAPGRIVAP